MNAKKDSASLKRFLAAIEALCETCGRSRVNGHIASDRTFVATMEILKRFGRTIHEAGFEIEHLSNLGEKHINAAFDEWVRVRKLHPKTLQNQKSRVKLFFQWIGKPQLAQYVASIDGMAARGQNTGRGRYADLYPRGFRVTTVATRSKSWRGVQVDIEALLTEAAALDQRFAAMLMMERAFGLRRKEALLINPWKADKGDKLDLASNITKNGRPREVVFRPGEYGDLQRQVLDNAKRQCRRWESLAWPELNIKQAQQRYYHLCRQLGLTRSDLGLTSHGLRAGHAEDVLLLRGVLPTTLGGITSMSPEPLQTATRYDISRTLGHNRESISSAYIGSPSRKPLAGASLGWAFGSPIDLDENRQVQLWVTEQPQVLDQTQGKLGLSGVKAQTAYVTAQVLEHGVEEQRLSVRQAVRKWRGLFAAVEDRMELIGLSLLGGDGLH